MRQLMALRVDPEARRRIARIAKRRRQTASEVVREAIDSFVERDEERSAPFALIADLVGCVHGGDRGRSAGGGRRVAEMLRRRRSRP